jgi:hypothetical protein
VQGVNRGAQANWPNERAENGTLADITFLELFPVVVAISIWGLHLRNKKLTFNIDNKSVTLNIFYCSKRQKDKTQVKQLRQSSPITYISKYTIEHNDI